MNHLLEPSTNQLKDWLAQHDQPTYRAVQVRKWLFRNRARSFDQMSDVPKQLRAQLARDYQIWMAEVVRHDRADDGTEKLLLGLSDGESIECVLLRDGDRRTVCISSQVGCAMGCVFCASGLDGVTRNLTSGEIVEQMLQLQQLLSLEERLSHIVVMGMGEPLANLDRLLPALDLASHRDGLNISARRITISTVGLPRAMNRLSEMQCRYHLAVSLHAPNDELRNRLVPVNRKIGLAGILRAADRYFEASGRQLTFEYVLLAGLNDHSQHARQLAHLLRGSAALLNVIPYNPVPGLPYRTPSAAAVGQFREILQANGIRVKFRQRKGHRINAACGQLRRSR
jgi:23S rRNA (adenine2503-C2)-methyltransferase